MKPASAPGSDLPLIDTVGQTALLVCEIRSMESKHPQPLFEDPYAHLFSRPDISEAMGSFMADDARKGLSNLVRYRTRWLDDVTRSFIDSGGSQVLALLLEWSSAESIRC